MSLSCLVALQGLCTECGKKLSDAEITMEKFEPVSRKIPILKKQLDTLQVSEDCITTQPSHILKTLFTSEIRAILVTRTLCFLPVQYH